MFKSSVTDSFQKIIAVQNLQEENVGCGLKGVLLLSQAVIVHFL